MSGLSTKRQIFVVAYLGEAKYNATEAARIAGFARPGQEGHRLLKNAEIQQAISNRVAELSMTAEEVLIRPPDEARGTMDDFLTMRKVRTQGELLRRVDELLAEVRAKIQFEEAYATRAGLKEDRLVAHQENIAGLRERELRLVMRLEWDADATEWTPGLIEVDQPNIDLAKAAERGKLHLVKSFNAETGRIELYDAQAAKVTLGKHHRLWVDRVEQAGNVAPAITSEEMAKALVAAKSFEAALIAGVAA